MNRIRSGRKALLVPSLIAVGALLVAACGDDKSGSSTTSAPTTTAAGATTTSAGATTTAAGATTTAGGGAATLAQAQAVVAQYLQRPTTIKITDKIGKAIPTGKKVVFITCGVPVCEKEAPIIQQATDLLGWTFEKISTDGTATSVTNAWDQAVREKPDVVLYTAFAKSSIATQIKTLSDGGTFISSCCHTDPQGDGIGYVISTPSQTGELGKIMASWVYADSNGGKPGVVYLDLPEFAILSSLATEFEKSFKAYCPDCSYTKKDFALADLGTAADQVVSFLRSNTDVKYVVMSTDSAFNLSSAIEAAGLKGIKIFGEGPGEANIADMIAGKQAASMYFDYYGFLFSMVDAAARHFAGVPDVPSQSPVPWILTKDNLPTQDPAEIFPAVPNELDLFKALWGK